jgi:hypothetical protein
MKISKQRLAEIIKEEYSAALKEARGRLVGETMIQRQSDLSDIIAQLSGDNIEDDAEYTRGYQDGFDNYPVADDATSDYDAGYEDGKLDAAR